LFHFRSEYFHMINFYDFIHTHIKDANNTSNFERTRNLAKLFSWRTMTMEANMLERLSLPRLYSLA
jgi:hypothetical protein